MAEDNAKSSIPGWLKAGVSSVFGLVGGAVLMYLTPLVNNAIKPPEPVANFGFQAQGLAVTFQNRAANATDGWWDFGDGSALEPFSPQQATVAHTYAKPGPYSVKLSLTNLFNEKADRTATVNVDAGSAPPPVIEDFKTEQMAPGVFKLVAKVKNADQVIWCSGENRPLEFSTEVSGTQEHWVTIKEPGHYCFRVVAVAGKQTVEKMCAPQVVASPTSAGAPSATVNVAYEAVHVDRKETVIPVRLPWKDGCRDSVCPVAVEWKALQGYHVVKAELSGTGKDSRVRGVPDVKVAPDGGKVIVSADLNRPTLFARIIPDHPVYIKVTQEKQSTPTKRAWSLPMQVKVPGQTVLPLPALGSYWQPTKRQVTLDLAEGERKIWSGPEMPVNRPVQLQGHLVMVSATVNNNNQLVLTVTNPVSGPTPIGH